MQAGQAEVARLLVPVLPGGGGGDGGGVLRQQKVHAGGFRSQALGAVLLAPRPDAAGVATLLPGIQPHMAAANVQRPDEAPGGFRRGRRFRIVRSGRLRQFFDGRQRLLPSAEGHGEGGQGGGTQLGMARIRPPVAVRDSVRFGVEATQDLAALRGHPGIAVRGGTGAKAANRLEGILVRRMRQPTALDAGEHGVDAARQVSRKGQAALRLHLRRAPGQIQADVVPLVPVPGGVDALQQVQGSGRVAPRQRQQRQGEGAGAGIEQPLALAAQRVQRLLDVASGVVVPAAQHRRQRQHGRLADGRRRGAPQVRRQLVEECDRGVEFALQYAHEGDVVGVFEGRVAKIPANVDQRLRRRAAVDDMRQASPAGGSLQRRWHCPHGFLGEGLGQQREVVALDVPRHTLEPLPVAGQQEAAPQDAGSLRVSVVGVGAGGLRILARVRPGAIGQPVALHGVEERQQRALRSRLAHERERGSGNDRDGAGGVPFRQFSRFQLGDSRCQVAGWRQRERRQRCVVEQALEGRPGQCARGEEGAQLR